MHYPLGFELLFRFITLRAIGLGKRNLKAKILSRDGLCRLSISHLLDRLFRFILVSSLAIQKLG
jgi:hypothetical protein